MPKEKKSTETNLVVGGRDGFMVKYEACPSRGQSSVPRRQAVHKHLKLQVQGI